MRSYDLVRLSHEVYREGTEAVLSHNVCFLWLYTVVCLWVCRAHKRTAWLARRLLAKCQRVCEREVCGPRLVHWIRRLFFCNLSHVKCIYTKIMFHLGI